MLPLTNHTVTYTVSNGDRNIVMLKKQQPLNNGVVSDKIEIHPDSKDGIWTITVVDDVTVSFIIK